MHTVNNGPMLNAYPDSMGANLSDIVKILKREEFSGAFTSFYILPSLFHTDLDRGFSVIDYSLNKMLAQKEDLEEIRQMGIDLKLDFILNHGSVLSKQFQDILKKGDASEYRDFFIDWNKFWEGWGEMTPEGYIRPTKEALEPMFFRKPGLPILMVRFPDGRDVPYWNTFYQEIRYRMPYVEELMEKLGIQYGMAQSLACIFDDALKQGKTPSQVEVHDPVLKPYKTGMVDLLESGRTYLGQMDLNIHSPLVWDFYEKTLTQLAEYGAGIVRLDAFAYAPKRPGSKNFLNDPDTWELLARLQAMADDHQLCLLPEIHAAYEENIYSRIAKEGYMVYDFFLPGLMIDALERGDGTCLSRWARQVYDRKIRTVNMLGCHDGIPVLDLKGLLPEERIQELIDLIVSRGGLVKDLHGQKNVYYQVNATYYSALGEHDKKMLAARALQLFMPGKPQIWYLDLFAGKNDVQAVSRAGAGGHKEINRTNLSVAQVEEALKKDVVLKQLELLEFRAAFPAFGFDAAMEIKNDQNRVCIQWCKNGYKAVLTADLKTCDCCVKGWQPDGALAYELKL